MHSLIADGFNDDRMFAVKLSGALLNRLRIESVRSGQTIRSIVSAALENALPETEIIVRKPARPRGQRIKADAGSAQTTD